MYASKSEKEKKNVFSQYIYIYKRKHDKRKYLNDIFQSNYTLKDNFLDFDWHEWSWTPEHMVLFSQFIIENLRGSKKYG